MKVGVTRHKIRASVLNRPCFSIWNVNTKQLVAVLHDTPVCQNLFEIAGVDGDYIVKKAFEIMDDFTKEQWYEVYQDQQVVGYVTYDNDLIRYMNEYIPSKRKFYKKVLKVTVLSETNSIPDGLQNVAYDITEGDMNGHVETLEETEVDAVEAAKLLLESGSDTEFFMLDEYGVDCG